MPTTYRRARGSSPWVGFMDGELIACYYSSPGPGMAFEQGSCVEQGGWLLMPYAEARRRLILRLGTDQIRQDDSGTVEHWEGVVYRKGVGGGGQRKGQSQKGHIEMSKPCTHINPLESKL